MILRHTTARWAFLALALAAGTAACSSPNGDDDDGSGGESEDGTGGTSEDGTGGTDGSGGESEDGTGGTSEDGTGGTTEEGEGGMGGDGSGGASGGSPGSGGATGGDGSGGATGGDGSGGGSGGTPPVTFDPITRAAEVLLPSTTVQDLRGLSYAPDGKLYASGFKTVDSDRHLVVLRFEDDGELDDLWGDEGVVDLNLVPRTTDGGTPAVVTNDGLEESFGVVELESGEVLVSANIRRDTNAGTRFVLIKLDEAGELVDGFGTDGIVPVQFGYAPATAGTWTDTAWSIALDTESNPAVEKLVVFGLGTAPAATGRTDNDRYITRVLTSDGSVDPDFNGGSRFTYNPIGTFSDGARRGQVLPGGGILSTGYTDFGPGFLAHVVLIKLTAAGTPDSSFGFGIPAPGVAVLNPLTADGGFAECYQAAVQSTGRIVTAGYGKATAALTASSFGYLTSVKEDVVTLGITARGYDDSYGTEGRFVVQSEADAPEPGLEALAAERYEERARGMIALPDDRLIIAGRYDLRPALYVSRPNGGLDETTGDDLSGIFLYDDVTPDTSHFFAIVVSADGTSVAATTQLSNPVAPEGVLLAILQVGD